MDVVAIIPARYGSTRFPGKPLASQTGKPLIQHVYQRVSTASRINRCFVATDDQRIADAVHAFGGHALLTSPHHTTGTDRIAETLQSLPGHPHDLIVNVQGDEPEINPDHLDRAIDRAARESDNCPIATLACPFPDDADPLDPNSVKVVLNSAHRALYFSRSLIPYPREGLPTGASPPCLLHLGVYVYRRWFLLEFAGWGPGKLEQIEKLEQLRVLERGYALAVEIVENACVGIDTPQDYQRFVARYRA